MSGDSKASAEPLKNRVMLSVKVIFVLMFSELVPLVTTVAFGKDATIASRALVRLSKQSSRTTAEAVPRL